MTAEKTHEAIEKAILTQLSPPSGSNFSKSWIQSVRKLSNHYVAEPESISPWREPWAQEALLSYYHPLNQARAQRVAQQGLSVGFFDGIEHIIDIGCGSGAGSLGFLIDLPVGQIKSLELSDHSEAVTQIAKKLVASSGVAPAKVTTSHQSIDFYKSSVVEPGTMLVLSYVLTESHSEKTLRNLLMRLSGLEAIAILEPSTSQDARRLQALRPLLLEMGFTIWAPCTHHGACPLLKDSDRDWCHDRLTPHLPPWWESLEAGLPMKNRTVTVSYLLARRNLRVIPLATEVRVIGDRLDEKTKVRQMICRHDQREFISWFPSRLKGEAENFELSRGDRFQTDESIWKDPRGIDRSKEYRLDLTAIYSIGTKLKTSR